jgi:16S rRNA processing protein RimM
VPVHVATIVRPRGLAGEVMADLPSRDPERLSHRDTFLIEDPDRGVRPCRVASSRPQGKRLVLRLEGSSCREDALTLTGRRLFLNESDLPDLPAGRFYTYRLSGLGVRSPDGRSLGTVVGCDATAAHDLLVVRRTDGEEAQVPMIDAFVRRIDLEAGTVVVDAPWGLLEGEAESVDGEP